MVFEMFDTAEALKVHIINSCISEREIYKATYGYGPEIFEALNEHVLDAWTYFTNNFPYDESLEKVMLEFLNVS